MKSNQGVNCPLPSTASDRITLLHGEGGRVMRRFLRERVLGRLGEYDVQIDADAADLGQFEGEVAITTDSFVVSPRFFPGGDIGSLCVHGVVNDLSVSCATPKYMTLAIIVEEGFAISEFDRIVDRIAGAAKACAIKIVAGDTKVVPKNSVDGMFLSATAVGVFREPRLVGPKRLKTGAKLIVSGPIGEHGFAVLCARESLGFTPAPKSDSSPLQLATMALHAALGSDLFAMRDATRGGVAAVCHEWAEACGNAMWIDESQLPLSDSARGVSEILGLDPLFVAGEGVFVAAVASHRADDALQALRRVEISRHACVIGEVQPCRVSPVLVRRGVGVDQPLDEPLAAMLPRIC
ncbi:hydrogenase expression/formation protein HypE [Stieleria varia]|uniref:Hydrogenase isoenzymes formation protein HypE n=1 Tax=Stieleria varia TaxID=2528005 RepID=A0A5C5ZVT4_9BACT|nr:hydrogenase expression/formation protein HypE [Stieleria varia]TWT91276.1 Hydrogenase isoenzymes formation protein HypE [Stieleria varia]